MQEEVDGTEDMSLVGIGSGHLEAGITELAALHIAVGQQEIHEPLGYTERNILVIL